MSIIDLNLDNLIDILDKLDHSEIAHLCSSSKEFNTLCRSERIWETLSRRKFGSRVHKLETWYVTYQNLIRPIYLVTISGDPDQITTVSDAFYSWESAIEFLMQNVDIRDGIRSELDLRNQGYSDLFTDFIMQYDFDDLDNLASIDYYLEGGDVAERDQFLRERDRFQQEYDSLISDFFTSNPTYTFEFENGLSYIISKTTVKP